MVFIFVRERSQRSYFELSLPIYVMASMLPSHLHVMPRLISIEVIWKHYVDKNFIVLNYNHSSVSIFDLHIERELTHLKKVESLYQERVMPLPDC